MNQTEKIIIIQTLLGNDAEATVVLLSAYLDLAKSKILNRMYPFGIPTSVTDVPAKYELLQCELVQRMFLRRGGEGEISHNENGVSRTYASVDDEDLMKQIVQVAKAV